MGSYRETILVDIDETSARTIEDAVYPFVNEQYGTQFVHDMTLDYRNVFQDIIIEQGKPISLQRKIELFNGAILADRWKNHIRPIAWSVGAILRLSEVYTVGMLTARHNMLKDYTPEWVRYHFNGSVSKVLFSNNYHGGVISKADVCKEEWARIVVEDDLDYALELAREWILVFLLRKPWNEHRKEQHKNIRRIDTWDDLRM